MLSDALKVKKSTFQIKLLHRPGISRLTIQYCSCSDSVWCNAGEEIDVPYQAGSDGEGLGCC